jgi:hypothetical protein
VRVKLRLPDGRTAVLEDHDRGVARRHVAVQVAPQPRNDLDLVDRHLPERAVVVATVDDDIRLTDRGQQRREVVGAHPRLRVRPHAPFRDVSAEWTRRHALAPVHAVRRVDEVLPQDRVPNQRCRRFRRHTSPIGPRSRSRALFYPSPHPMRLPSPAHGRGVGGEGRRSTHNVSVPPRTPAQSSPHRQRGSGRSPACAPSRAGTQS